MMSWDIVEQDYSSYFEVDNRHKVVETLMVVELALLLVVHRMD
jgi:hypothetical protein